MRQLAGPLPRFLPFWETSGIFLTLSTVVGLLTPDAEKNEEHPKKAQGCVDHRPTRIMLG